MSSRFVDYSLEVLLDVCKLQGDPDAWEEFIARTQRAVHAVVRRELRKWPSVAADAVDDLVQEVFLRITANGGARLDGFESRHTGAILGYLCATAVTVTIDYCKAKSAVKRGAGCRDRPLEEADAVGDWPKIETAVLLSQVDQILIKITPGEAGHRDRIIFWLYYRQGFSAHSIALIPWVELTTKGVESVIQRLTKLVRQELTKTMDKRKSPADAGRSLESSL